MKNLIILFALLAVSLRAISLPVVETRYSISGRITDEEGSPLPGASVILEGTYLGTSSDLEGRYLIEGLRQGEYSLQISFIGYETFRVKVALPGDSEVNATLKYATILADEIVVKGVRASQYTPVARTELKGETIRRSNTGQDIPYILSLVPSLVETSESGTGIGYTNFRIRGTDPSRINVSLDGIPMNDPESHQVFWVDMPDIAGSLSDIQVQRGVGTSTNGAGAFGASINMRLANPSTEPYVEISSSIGSFGTFKGSVKLGTGLIKDKLMIDMRISGIMSDGYIDRSWVSHRSVFATALYRLPKGNIKLNFIHGEEITGISWMGVPADSLGTNRTFNPAGLYLDDQGYINYYHNETDNYTQSHFQLIYNRQLGRRLYLNAAGHFTRGLGYYEQFKEDQYLSEYGLGPIIMEGFYPVIVTFTDLVRRKWMFNYFTGMVYNLNYSGDRLSLTFGGGVNNYLGDHFGRIIWMRTSGPTDKDYTWYSNGSSKNEINTFLKANYRLTGKIDLFGDLQYRYISYRMTGYDDSIYDLWMDRRFNFLNPKAGVFFRINSNNEAYLSASVANREPTRANYKDAAGDSLATPQPERLLDLEAGYGFKSTMLSANINIYYMRYRDQLVPTGRLSNVGYPIMTNVPVSYRAGLEFMAGFRPSSLLELNASINLGRSIIKDYIEFYTDYNSVTEEETYLSKPLGDVPIAYSPAVVASGEIVVSPARSLSLHLTGKYTGSQYFDNTMNSQRMIDPYLVGNLRIDYDLALKGIESINLQFLVNNIFNNQYVNNAYGGNWYTDGQEYTWAYYFPQAGINWLTRITVRF